MEGLIAILIFLGAAIGAALTVHWQRAQHQAETIHRSFREAAEVSADLTLGVSAIIGLLGVEGATGFIHEFQRAEFRDANRRLDLAALTLANRLAVLRVIDTRTQEPGRVLVKAAEGCVETARQIVGWGPHPTMPAQSNARVTVLQQGVTHLGLAQDLGERSRAFGSQLDSLAEIVARRYRRLFVQGRWLNGILYGMAIIAVLAVLYAIPRATWKAELHNGTVVWTNAWTQQVRVTPVPGMLHPAAPGEKK